jgi:prophage tail gpP-like protein
MPRAPQTEPTLTINWANRAKSAQPRGIIGYSIDTSYLTSTDEFEIEVFDTDPARLRWLALEPVELLIHGEVALVGRIEQIERGGGSVKLRGRDYFADIVQGELDPSVKITESQTFQETILYCAGPSGINSVVDFTGAGAASLQPKERKPDPGQGIFDFLNQIAARLGCTLQPTANRGEVALDAPDFAQSPSGTLLRSDDPIVQISNNVMEPTTSTEDYTRLPTHGLSSGKVAVAGENASSVQSSYNLQDVLGGISDAMLNNLSGKVDGNRRKPDAGAGDPLVLYRLLYVKDDKLSRTTEQIDHAIVRSVSERLKDTLVYSPTISGHRDETTKKVWSVNTVLDVQDSVCDIEERLWVCGRRFDYSRSSGSTTALKLWRLGAFQI